MAVETDVERAIMLADFGESVTYTPSGGSASTITGIFDKEYQAVDTGGEVAFAVEQPRLAVRTSDVASAAEGDSVVISGVNYIVRVVMNDGTGLTDFALEKQ